MPQTRRPTKEAERSKLKKVIVEWNASRLDMFAMSDPSEDLEFHGVMRFFFQDMSHRVATKCVRVSSTATTQQVVNALIERFRPDMKMLTATALSLFEVFSNGEERRLKANDKPLLIQLNWHKDDREGRFLLRRDSSDRFPGLATIQRLPDTTPEKPVGSKVKRRFSKKDRERERRDIIKERTHSFRLRPTSTDDTSLRLSVTGQGSVAEALYDELPESTLTRSISNPEAVMRRRRQQKFEKKLQAYSKDGENSGDLLRVYAETLCPEFPYKTLLVTVNDITEVVVKEAVDKFGLGKHKAKDFCLVLSSMSVTGAKRTWRSGPERVVQNDEFPLKIKQEWASTKSEPSFHLRKRPCLARNPSNIPVHQYQQLAVQPRQETSQETEDLPYLIEVTAEGHMTPDAVKFKLQPNVTQIGSEQARSATGGLAVNLSQLLLPFADIQPRHCKLASMSGVVTLTPLSPQAETFINGERVSETTLLQNRSTIQFGSSHTFLYVDPRQAKRPVRAAPSRQHSLSAVIQSNGPLPQQYKGRTSSERSSHPIRTTYNGQPQEVAYSDFTVPFSSEPAKQEVIAPSEEKPPLDRSTAETAVSDCFPVGTSVFLKATKNTTRTNSERRPSASSGDTSNPGSFHCQSSLSSYSAGQKKSTDVQGDIKHFGRSTDVARDLSQSLQTPPSQSLQTPPSQSLQIPPSHSLQPPSIVKTRKQQSGRSRLSSGSDSVFEVGASRSSELPALLAFGDYSEDSLLNAVVRRCNGAAAPFKLAPAYVLYLCAKYRLSPQCHDHSVENADRGSGRSIVKLVSKAVTLMSQTVQESAGRFGDLCFWLANSSEFLHFLKMDGTLADPAATVTLELESVIQTGFYQLVDCLQQELCTCITSFLEVSDTDDGMSGEDQTCEIIVTKLQNDIPAWIHPSWQATNEQGQPTVTSLLSTLSRAMALMRCCRVNASFTIQLFSHAFHYINAWLFNKLVREPRLGLCCRAWGEQLRERLQRVEGWAERQGLELAVECHMAQVMQACRLLVASKSSPDDVSSIASLCPKLNSLQLQTLLQLYHPAFDEPPMFPKLIAGVVGIAESTADELTRSDGKEVKLEEETHLMAPFLVPGEGYSCDIVTGMPAGLAEFLGPLSKQGLCKLSVYSTTGSWAPWQSGQSRQSGIQSPVSPSARTAEIPLSPSAGSRASDLTVQSREGPSDDRDRLADQIQAKSVLSKQPEVVELSILKGDGGLGVSIIGGKNCGDANWGIYVKSIVRGGKADKDGRLQAGDQLLQVDRHSLLHVTQEEAAQIMKKTGPIVKLKIAKQAALYHGIAISESSSASKPQGHQETIATSSLPSNRVLRRHRQRSDDPSPRGESRPQVDERHSMGDFSPSKPQLVKWLYEQQQQRAQQNAEKQRAKRRNDPTAEAMIEEQVQQEEKEHKERMEQLRKENEAKQVERQLSDRRQSGRLGQDEQVLHGGVKSALESHHSEPSDVNTNCTPVPPQRTESSASKVKELSEKKEHERLLKVELEWRKAFAAESTRGAQEREQEELERHRSEEELRRRILADSQYLERKKREKAFLEKLSEEGGREGEVKQSYGMMDGPLPNEGRQQNMQKKSALDAQGLSDMEESRLDIEIAPERRTRRPAGSSASFNDQETTEISIETVSVDGLSSVTTDEPEKTQDFLVRLEQPEDDELVKQERLMFEMQQEKAHQRELERQAMLKELKQEEELAMQQEKRLEKLRKQREIRLKQLYELDSHEEEEHHQWLEEQKRRKIELERQRQAQEDELHRLQEENSTLEALHKRRVARFGSSQNGSPEVNKGVQQMSRVISPKQSHSRERQQSQPDLSAYSRPPVRQKGSYTHFRDDDLPEASRRSRLALAQYSHSSSRSSDGFSESSPDLRPKRVHRTDGMTVDADRRREPKSVSPVKVHHNETEWSQLLLSEDTRPSPRTTTINAAKRAEFFNSQMQTRRHSPGRRPVESTEDASPRVVRRTQSTRTHSNRSSQHTPGVHSGAEADEVMSIESRRLSQNAFVSATNPAHGNKALRHRTGEPSPFREKAYQPPQADV